MLSLNCDDALGSVRAVAASRRHAQQHGSGAGADLSIHERLNLEKACFEICAVQRTAVSCRCVHCAMGACGVRMLSSYWMELLQRLLNP